MSGTPLVSVSQRGPYHTLRRTIGGLGAPSVAQRAPEVRSEDHLVRQGDPSTLVAQRAYHTLKGFLGSPGGAFGFRSLRGPSHVFKGPSGG